MSEGTREPHDDLLSQVIAGYLALEAAGQAPDRQKLIEQHLDLADELVAFFAEHDRQAPAELTRPKTDRSVTWQAPTIAQTPSGGGDVGDRVPARPLSVIRYFGDYELLEEIARGGMGVVYKARQVKLNRIVALKMILAGQLATQHDVQRFYREAEAAGQLDHPGIVPIFEVGQHQGQHYFSMGFVEGQSLASRLAEGPLAPRHAAELLRKVAEAVQYAHDKGVIHRDLKPANILLALSGQQSTISPDGSLNPLVSTLNPKITDFGLAKRGAGRGVGESPASGLTGDGQVLGTPSYMPPEQATGRLDQVGTPSDVYSLGATLYHALTGRPPFQAATTLETLLQVLEQEPVAVRQLNRSVPHDLETICLKCLRKDPAKRYSSARDLAEDIRRFLGGEPIRARPAGPLERGWRWCMRRPAQAVAAMLLVTLSIGGPTMAWNQALLRQAEAEQRERAERSAYNAQLGRIGSLIDTSPADASEALFDETRLPVRFREFAWGALHRRLEKKVRVLTNHRDLVGSMTFSADSSRLASVDLSGAVKLWDVSTGKELKTLFNPDRGITWLEVNKRSGREDFEETLRLRDGAFWPVGVHSYSPCGRYLAVHLRAQGDDIIPDEDQPVSLHIFDLQSSENGLVLENSRRHRFSPKESLLVSDVAGALAFHWLGTTKAVNLALPDGWGKVADLVFDRAGESLLVLTTEGSLARVDLTGDPLTIQSAGKIEISESALAKFSPDGKHVASLTRRSNSHAGKGSKGEWWLAIHNLHAGLVDQECVNQDGGWIELHWLADGQRMLIRTRDSIRLVDLLGKTIEDSPSLRPTSWWLNAMVEPHTGLHAYTVHDKKNFPLDIRWIKVRAIDGNGQVLLDTRYQGEFFAEQMAQLKPDGGNWSNPPSSLETLAASRNGRFLASAAASRQIRVWDLQSPELDWKSAAHSKRLFNLQFSPDGSRLFSVGEDKQIVHWNVETGAVLHHGKFVMNGDDWMMNLSADGNRAIIFPLRKIDGVLCVNYGDLYVWDVVGERKLLQGEGLASHKTRSLTSEEGAYPYLSHNGKLLVEQFDRTQVVIWNTETGEEQCRVAVNGKLGNSTLGRDGTIITCARDAERSYLQFWDITNGRLRQTRELKGVRIAEDSQLTPMTSILAVSASGRFVVGSNFLNQRVWYDLGAEGAPVVGDYVTPDGRRVLSFHGKDRSLTITERDGGSQIVPIPVDNVLFDFSQDGQTMFTANVDATYSCWDSLNGQERIRLKTGLRTITRMAVSPRGDAVALGDEGGSVAVIRASSPPTENR